MIFTRQKSKSKPNDLWKSNITARYSMVGFVPIVRMFNSPKVYTAKLFTNFNNNTSLGYMWRFESTSVEVGRCIRTNSKTSELLNLWTNC